MRCFLTLGQSHRLALGCVCLAQACGGRTGQELRPSDLAAATYRAVAVVTESQLEIVLFENPEAPLRIPLSGDVVEPERSLAWAPDGLSLAFQARREDGNWLGVASAPDWSPREVQLPGSGPAAPARWIGESEILLSSGDSWQLINVESWKYETGSVPVDFPDVWDEPTRASTVIPVPDGSLWIHGGRAPRFVAPPEGTYALVLPEPGDRLLGVSMTQVPAGAESDESLWFLSARSESGCNHAHPDCFPEVWKAADIGDSGLLLLGTQIVQGGIPIRSMSLLAWGSSGVLGEENQAGELRLAEWEHPTNEYVPHLDEDYLYLVPTRAEAPTSPMYRVGLDRPFQDLTLEELGDVATPATPALASPALLIERFWFALDPSATGAPRAWRKLDLPEASEAWRPTSFVGEVGVHLGKRGGLFLDLGRAPLADEVPCSPCRYSAVRDLSDERSLRLSGEFHLGAGLITSPLPIQGVPDGSGVLIRNGEWLEFESFSLPGVRNQLTRIGSNTFVLLPPTWRSRE